MTDQETRAMVELRARLACLGGLGNKLDEVRLVFARQRRLWMSGEWTDKKYFVETGKGIDVLGSYPFQISRWVEGATCCLDLMEGNADSPSINEFLRRHPSLRDAMMAGKEADGPLPVPASAPKVDEFTPAERAEWEKVKAAADAATVAHAVVCRYPDLECETRGEGPICLGDADDRESCQWRFHEELHVDFLKSLLIDVGVMDDIFDHFEHMREVTKKDLEAWVDGKRNDKEHCRDMEGLFDYWDEYLAKGFHEVRELGWSIENVTGMQPASLGGSGEEPAPPGEGSGS